MRKLVFVVLVVSAQNMYAPDYSQDEKKEVARALAACYQALTGAAGALEKVPVVMREDDEQSEVQKEDWKAWGRALALETRGVVREMFGI